MHFAMNRVILILIGCRLLDIKIAFLTHFSDHILFDSGSIYINLKRDCLSIYIKATVQSTVFNNFGLMNVVGLFKKCTSSNLNFVVSRMCKKDP